MTSAKAPKGLQSESQRWLKQVHPVINRMNQLVRAQLEDSLQAFIAADTIQARKIEQKDDAVNNLNIRVEGYCARQNLPAQDFTLIPAVLRLASNMEKIGDYAANIAGQTKHLGEPPAVVLPISIAQMGETAIRGLNDAVEGFLHNDLERALHACESEGEIDQYYSENLNWLVECLKRNKHDAGQLVTVMFVLKYLEKAGDAVLNIGEISLWRRTGEKIKVDQFLKLRRMMNRSRMTIRAVPQGTSGDFVGLVSDDTGSSLLFKSGTRHKVEEEAERIEQWNKIIPGIAPKVLVSVDDEREGDGMLREYVQGLPYEEILMRGPDNARIAATNAVLTTLGKAYQQTVEKKAPNVWYIKQIEVRLEELFRLHPPLRTLRDKDRRIGSFELPGLKYLLEQGKIREAHWASPVTCWIHGDCNVDNLFIENNSLRLIDVHRSGPGDYIQDISVLMVSIIRHPSLHFLVQPGPMLPVLDAIREFGRRLAQEFNDENYEDRLTLALARSLLTSGRVTADFRRARKLFLAGIQKLEKVAQCPLLK